MVKLNSAGQIVWENLYTGMRGSLVPEDAAVDVSRDCIYVLGGREYSPWDFIGQRDLEVARFSLETGQVEWASPAPLPEFPFTHPITFAHAVAVDARGSVYTSAIGANEIGRPDGNYLGPPTVVIHKFNEHGRLLWDYVDYRGWSSSFEGVLLAEPWGCLYLGAFGTIKAQAFASHPEGDSNLDGIIDDEDLTRILLAFGTTDSLADIDENGIVNEADFTMALSNYGLDYDRAEGRGEGVKRR